jgi:hypothetical protein
MPEHSETPIADKKLLRLNQWQTAAVWITLMGAIFFGGLAYAKGWLGVPDKIDKLEISNAELIKLPPRIAALEADNKELWQKLSGDHDLLLKIAQGQVDLADSMKEQRRDMRDLRDKK